MPTTASRRSSSSSSALRLAVAAAAAALLAAGCGGSSSRKETSAYVDRVNAVVRQLAAPLQRVELANRSFARSPASPAVATKLASSEATLRRLERRLKALDPPPEARRLQTLLLRLVAREATLAGEVEQLARFLPRFRAALAPVAPASRALDAVLGDKSAKAVAKAEALERYGAALAAAERRLRPLRPPPVSVPVWRQEKATLTAVRSSGDALAAGLRARQAKRLPALLHAFDVASAQNRTLAAQRAQIAAVQAYDARVAGLEKLATAVGREERRLQAKLG